MNISLAGGASLMAGAPVSGCSPSVGGGNEAKIKELEKKLEHLTEEKKKAEQNHDAEKVKKLEQEIQKVRQELAELKRKGKKEEDKKKEKEERKPENQTPLEGAAGQYLNTWA